MANRPQTGITAAHPQFARHVLLKLKKDFNVSQLKKALAQVPELTRAFSAQFEDANISSTIALSHHAWDAIYAVNCPKIVPFPAVELERETIQPSNVDFFLHIRSDRFDIAVELSLSILHWFKHDTDLYEETVGYRYFGGRDLTGFSGHTSQEMTESEKTQYGIARDDDPIIDGGSYINIQRYLFDMPRWQNLPMSAQEEVMGKDKRQGHELHPDEEDMPHIHRVRKAGNLKLVRAGMPYGDAKEQGHFFVSYANRPDAFIRVFEAMTHPDGYGNSDPLLRYAKPVNGASLFAPSIDFLNENSL